MIWPLEAKAGADIPAEVWIDNMGVAPIYRPYVFAYRFRQGKAEHVVHSAQDIRKWMPDHTWFSENVRMPQELERGEAKIDVAIVDGATDKPRVKLAVKEIMDDGWHPMTSIDIV
jgi:hypothetical protein